MQGVAVGGHPASHQVFDLPARLQQRASARGHLVLAALQAWEKFAKVSTLVSLKSVH